MITAKNITKIYGAGETACTALNDVSLTIDYALVELFSFGTLYKFYKNMKPADKKGKRQPCIALHTKMKRQYNSSEVKIAGRS